MNTLTKFALVITSIVLPLSANAALESNSQDSTTLEKNDVVKLVDKEMKLNTSELVNSLKLQEIALIPDSYSIVLAKAEYKK